MYVVFMALSSSSWNPNINRMSSKLHSSTHSRFFSTSLRPKLRQAARRLCPSSAVSGVSKSNQSGKSSSNHSRKRNGFQPATVAPNTSISTESPMWKAALGLEQRPSSSARSNISREGFSNLQSSDVRMKSKTSLTCKSILIQFAS